MITIAPLGMRGVLPAFVVGHERYTEDLAALTAPAFVLDVAQQAGGYAMSYPSVVGVVLRLDANLERGFGDTARALRAFAAMSEDHLDLQLLEREFPSLRPLAGTIGRDYTRAQISTLESFVRRSFFAPDFESGLEAFIRCAPCDPLDHFHGWHALSVASDRDYVDCYDGIATDDLAIFDEAMLASLAECARALGVEAPPRVFFMWENSD